RGARRRPGLVRRSRPQLDADPLGTAAADLARIDDDPAEPARQQRAGALQPQAARSQELQDPPFRDPGAGGDFGDAGGRVVAEIVAHPLKLSLFLVTTLATGPGLQGRKECAAARTVHQHRVSPTLKGYYRSGPDRC